MIRPALVVVIGANGAGKTTWARANRDLLPSPFYNADSIAKGLGDANSVELQLRARALVDRELAERLANGEDFGFESTWSGASRPAIVRDAANTGYQTRAVFLGTNAAHINIERVRRRVLEGGHNVPESEIRRRWDQAFANLLAMRDAIETIDVLDSPRDPVQLIAEKRDGETSTLASGLPAWAERIAERNPKGRRLEV